MADPTVSEVLWTGHFEVIPLFLSLSVHITTRAARRSAQSWMNDLEQSRRAVLPWRRSLAQPLTAGCNSTPRILAGAATLIKRLWRLLPLLYTLLFITSLPHPSSSHVFTHTPTGADRKESISLI